ncbi:MAG: S-adenosyl-l-methionine hydroxide adenosyltransferase family protein [Flavobacteriales bacterium]
MQIITLTSDIGLKDYYVASVKGKLLQEVSGVTVIDITHYVKPFEVAEAAYQLRSCYSSFPAGTIHLVGVDTEPYLPYKITDPSQESQLAYPSILLFDGHYFITNDNGFIGTFLGEDVPEALYRYTEIENEPESWVFMMKTCFVHLAGKIADKTPFNEFTTEVKSYKKAFTPNPIIEHNVIQGNVIHIDHFGNIITNIFKQDFERFGKDIPFTISYQKRNYDIDVISRAYNDVTISERVAIFNDAGRLEIAINRGANGGNGGADRLFGMRLGEPVRITFYPKGSVPNLDALL